MLHREAGVPGGPCEFEELKKFQDFLGPHGYQLIVVEPSKCLIVFKEAKYYNTPHVISLVKHQDHFDGFTSIPALINRSYYCRLCDKGYDVEGAAHHNCCGQNCPACLRKNKTCPNYAGWVKPTLECPNCNCKFYGQDCFEAHKKKGKKEDDKSICESWRKSMKCSAEFHLIPTNRISVTMSPALTVGNLSMSTIDVSFSRSSRKKTPPKKTHLKIPWHFKMRMMTRMKRKVHPLPLS